MHTEHEHTYNVTHHGLHHWSKAMFEKLGWMLLAERDGHHHKIASYKRSLAELVEAIEEKIKCTHDADRIEDLQIIHKNVKTLVEHVNRDFKERTHHTRSSRRKSSKRRSHKSRTV